MKRRFLSVTIILSMLLLTLIPLSVSAATSGTCGSNLTWVLDNDGILTISGTGAMYNWEYYDEVPWYSYTNNIKVVYIGDNVTSIGDCAFAGCSNLLRIELPDNMDSIGEYAFAHCVSLVSIVIPNGVQAIDEATFYDCFSLQSVTIPESLVTVLKMGFCNCKSLSTVYIDGTVWNVKNIYADNEPFKNATRHFLTPTSGICGDNLSWKLDNSGKLTVSGTGDMYNFEDEDPEWYDSKSSIKEIVLNAGVTSVGDYAFSNCTNLTKLSMPEGITEIGTAAFMDCNKLENFVMPSTVIHIYSSAFSRCKNLTDIILPDNLSFLGEGAFGSCGFSEISIPDGTTIGPWAFGYCSNLKKVIIGKDCLIRDYSFYDCYNINDLTIKDGVTIIGEYAFNDCNGLTAVVLPDSMKYIYPYAFYNCSNLESITLPTNLFSIGNSAFDGCNKLTNVYYNGSESQWDKITIGDSNTSLTKANIIYKIQTIKLTYDLNGGEGEIEAAEIEENSTAMISSSTPAKDGYTFLGWSTSNSAKTAEYQANDTIKVGTEDITLYAVWKKTVCTGTQFLNGIFLVTPTGAENGNRIIFVCYNGNKMVYVNSYVYAGETTIPFTTTETYDKVKVMVWENSETCVPLCEAEDVPLTNY